MTGRARLGAGLALAALAGCGRADGLGVAPPPLVTFTVSVSGDLGPLVSSGSPDTVMLRAALVWGEQWQTEPFCILPPESKDAAAVIAAGCRDPFGFVPVRVAASTAVTIGQPATLALYTLPSADVMVGDLTARIAYASVVVYDDRDGDGTLQLAVPHRTLGRTDAPPLDDTADSLDVVYGASFVTMTAPDQRVAYREGAFVPTAFYPRSGCADPPPRFSVLSAGGFAAATALASAIAGHLPPEDPALCATASPDTAVIHVALQPPAQVLEVSCRERIMDRGLRYLEPPDDLPDLPDRVVSCAHIPSFDAGGQTNLLQAVVSGRSIDRCKGLTHYSLRGCDDKVNCSAPEWDHTMHPPAWWPCKS